MLEKEKAKGPVSWLANSVPSVHSYSSYSEFFYQYFKNDLQQGLNTEENRGAGTE